MSEITEILSISNIILAALIVFVGAFVQTSIGFGLAVVSAPLLFLISPAYVPAPVTIATTFNCLFVLWYFRQNLSIKQLIPAFVWRVPGSVCGAALLWVINDKLLALLMAFVIGIGVLVNYLRIPIALNKRNLGIAGFFSGLMGTSTSIGGPPMAIVLQGQPPNIIRSQLSAFFLFSCFVSIVILILTGHLKQREWEMGLLLAPSTLLGSWVGAKFSGKLNASAMRNGTLVVCMVSVVIMLSKSFLS